MSFRLGVSQESLKGGFTIAPAGLYKVRLIEFKPRFSKPDPSNPDKPRSINLNARMEVLEHPEFEKPVSIFEGLNQNAGWILQDFCHGFGLPMETDGTESWLPGTWDSKPDFDPSIDSTYFYQGPLTGRIAQVEVAEETYNGKPQNKIRRYFCAVEDCATKFPEIQHSENLLRKGK